MTGVKLSKRIRYLHCQDEDGAHGILVLVGSKHYPTKFAEINDQADFKFWWKNFKIAEETLEELKRPHRPLAAV